MAESFDLATLLAAPSHIRTALKQAKSGADTAESLHRLQEAAELLQASNQPAATHERCACHVFAKECGTSSHRVETVAQAAAFIEQSRTWLCARERLAADDNYAAAERPAYVSFDAERYDFRGLVLRMLAECLEGEVFDDDDGNDPLAMLHTTSAGRRELGYLTDFLHAADDSSFEHSAALDEATRYGCNCFNRAWKNSALRDEFLQLYDRFVEEVIEPMLRSSDDDDSSKGGPPLVYQAVPVFRVFLPGHLAVGPRHTDAQYHPQPDELNFWVPLTDAYGSNSLYVESSAGVGDFRPIECGNGTLYRFRGNECEHFTELNLTNATRVSFDFRVICPKAGEEWPEGPPDAPTDEQARGKAAFFTVGEGRYYKRLQPSDSDHVGLRL